MATVWRTSIKVAVLKMMTLELTTKIRNRKAIIGIIGLGYVGLPLALEFARKGFRVVGFDVDEKKVQSINSSKSYIHHISSGSIASAVDVGFSGTTDFGRISEVDVVIICVPTPLTQHREPDLSFIIETGHSISRGLKAGQLVVLESTTYPGTTRDVLRPILESGGLKAGQDFYLAFSPEREDPSNPSFTTATIPKVVGGLTPTCGELANSLYETIVVRTVPVSTCEVAEAAKILENTFRAVNIAMVNELKMVFTRMGIDIWEVIDAAATKPFGFMKFTPGPGLGGHCIPIDPFYLTWKAQEFDTPVRFIEMAGEINTQMPYWVCQRTLESMSRRGIAIKGARILVVGLAYKKNVDDDRESPAYKLMSIFSDYGAEVDYHDPFVPSIRLTRHYPSFAGKCSVPIANAPQYDAVVICTNHDAIDWESLKSNAKLIIDTRGVYRDSNANIVPA